MKMVIFTVAMLASGAALADAPFCVATSYGRNCWYYTPDECIAAARSANGMCINNPDSHDVISGSAPFCVRTAYGTQCFYYSADACQDAASSQNGVCVYNPQQ